jgi:hypothetical protein
MPIGPIIGSQNARAFDPIWGPASRSRLDSMPIGHVKWFDPASHEARIVDRSGGEYPAAVSQMEPSARTADVPVTFKLRTEGGVTRALDVRLRKGTRVSPTHGRFGDLSGAKHPTSTGRAPLARQRSEAGLDADALITRVARQWVDAIVSGDRLALLRLYAPDCVIHTHSGAEAGHRAVQASIDRNPLLGSGQHDVQIRGIDSRIRVSWQLSDDDEARVPLTERRTQTTLRVAHGQIAEQWG